MQGIGVGMATTYDWTGRQGDTEKLFEFTCADANGRVDLSGALAVRFHLAKAAGKPIIIDADATVLDDGTGSQDIASGAPQGDGQYEWLPTETDDLIGAYVAEIEVTMADGKPLTFPDGDNAYSHLFFSKQLA